MIPDRTLSSEIFANDLKGRVTACRKRLRLNRIHRIHFDNQVGELFCDTAIEASDFCDHSEANSRLRKSLVNIRNGETSQPVNGTTSTMTKRLE
jgi:hypothetical protein